jgi:pseudoazurin
MLVNLGAKLNKIKDNNMIYLEMINMTIRNILITFLAFFALILPNLASAADHVIKAGARAFETPLLYVAEGDKVKFSNMNSHNSVSVEGLIPEGATAWAGKLGENVSPALDKPGIYSYVCQPHIGFGMVGVIVVGDVSAEDIAAYKQKAMDTLEGPFRRLIGKINKLKPTK